MIVFIHSIFPKLGIRIQDSMSTLKAGVLLLVCILGLAVALGGYKSSIPSSGNFQTLFHNSNFDPPAIINSFFQVLFIYDGWSTINYSLSELKDPIQNLPKVSFGSFSIIYFLFTVTTLAYFSVVPVSELGPGSEIIAVQFFKATLGTVFGGKILPLLILYLLFLIPVWQQLVVQ
jgi:amino acid transporter